jgi:hypothetical protein
MRARPRTKASKKRLMRVREARRIKKKYRHNSVAGVQLPIP